MAMNLVKEKETVVIVIPTSEIIIDCRLEGLNKIKDSDVTGYYTNDDGEKKQMIVDFFDGFSKEFYIDSVKTQEYSIVIMRYVYPYKNCFSNKMKGIRENIAYFLTEDKKIPKMFFGGKTDRYLKFHNDDQTTKKFKELLYDGVTNLIIEKRENGFAVYPQLRQNFFEKLVGSLNDLKLDETEEIEKFEDVYTHSVYGIHIKRRNDALSNTNPHICVGWSKLGDLSSISTKEELYSLYANTYLESSPNAKGQNIGQIWRFINEASIGDYVVFAEYDEFHIGRIESVYLYDDNFYPDRDTDYTNIRKVTWLKTNISRKVLSREMHNALKTGMSFFRINDYKSVIVSLLNDSYEKDENDNVEEESVVFKEGINKIFYGTPGCGKSFIVQELYCKKDMKYVRTTFYPDYSNTDFIGQIIPTLDEDNKPVYVFNEGPFSKALAMAYRYKNEPVTLIIEELNRGNAAAIFGDLFQLLDRDFTGESRYDITNFNLTKYLKDELKNIYSTEDIKQFEKIMIPANLSIIATMNTSDQNVYPLDTAFQRRWQMEKVRNNFIKEECLFKVQTDENEYDIEENYVSSKAFELAKMFIPGTATTWRGFVETLNNRIADPRLDTYTSEDKQMGIYFVDEDLLEIDPVKDDKNREKMFAEKILKYVWDDIAKLNPSEWFIPECNSLDKALDEFNNKHLDIFLKIEFPISKEKSKEKQ